MNIDILGISEVKWTGMGELPQMYVCKLTTSKNDLSQYFLGGASGKESACQCRRHERLRFEPWVGKIPWRRAWQPLQYSCLENRMNGEAWWALVPWVKKSQSPLTQLSVQACVCACVSVCVYK